MFGTFHLRNINNYDQILPLSKIAEEPKDVNIDKLYEKFKNSTTAIKTKLLDQTNVAGLGNIYVDEALFAAKIHPQSQSKNISKEQLKDILKNGQRIMDKKF